MKSKLITLIFLFSALTAICQSTGEHTVTIARDKWGVAHIFGKYDYEVAYGLAWANAEDNFSTMQQLYMVGKGIYGKYAGPSGAVYDYAVKSFRVKELVNERYELDLSPQFRKYIDGYVQGINEYAKQHPKEVLIKGLFPLTGKEIIQTYTVLLMQEQGVASVIGKILDNKTPDVMAQLQVGAGSNGVAISKRKTDEQKTFLLINPHQPLTGIGSNYEVHLFSEEGLNVHGGFWHGAMNPATFASEFLALMTTSNHLDLVDVFQLQMDNKAPLQYIIDNQKFLLEKSRIKIKVRLNKFLTIPVKRTVYWSRFGATFKNKKGFYSVRLGGNMKISAAEQIYRMNKANSFEEFKKYAEYFPMENFVYADKNDTIYMVNNGLVPRRNGIDASDVLPGNNSKFIWNDFLTIDELPHYVNPHAGYLFNVNNSIFDGTDSLENLIPGNYPKDLYDLNTSNNRSLRMHEMMNEFGPTISYEEFKKMKYDVQLPSGFSGLAFLDDIQQLDESKYPSLAEYIKVLRNWDRRNNADSKGAAAFLVLTWYFYSQTEFENFYQENKYDDKTYIKALEYVKEFYRKHYGGKPVSLVSLGDILRYQRGKVNLPLSGYPDSMGAMTAFPDKNGIFNRLKRGDGFVMFVQYSDGHVEIETSQAFGNSSKKDSNHYTDQMELYVNRQTKKMSLSKDEVLKSAETKKVLKIN